jgi:hypothetical protein
MIFLLEPHYRDREHVSALAKGILAVLCKLKLVLDVEAEVVEMLSALVGGGRHHAVLSFHTAPLLLHLQ